jgi:hypothetical protein
MAVALFEPMPSTIEPEAPALVVAPAPPADGRDEDAYLGESLIIDWHLVVSPCVGRFQLAPPVAEVFRRDFSWRRPTEHVRVWPGMRVATVGGADVVSPFYGWLGGLLALPGTRVHAGEPIVWLHS